MSFWIACFHYFRFALLAPFIVILCPVLFTYEYLVCHSPQLVDDVRYIPRPLLNTLKYTLFGIILVPLIIAIVPFTTLPALGYALVWLLKSRMPKLEAWSFRIMVSLRYSAIGIVLLLLIPIVALIIFPIMFIVTVFRLGIWNIIFYQYIPAWILKWNKQIYKPLDANKREIRLIEILRGSGSDPVQCRLVTARHDAAQYEALSYAWGGHLVLRTRILLNGRAFFITDGVSQALKELRLPKEERVLWIDAICINQADYQERREQVQQMRQIYENAQRVVVWLGRAPKGADVEFERLKSSNEDLTAAEILHSEAWTSVLRDITSRKWWSRVWVLQEIVCAGEAVVRVGRHETSWQNMSGAISTYAEESNSKTDGIKDVFEFIKVVKDLKSTRADPEFGLLQLAETFRHRQATDQRDKLYALLGLLKNPDQINIIQPDYQSDSQTVFAQFTAACIVKYKSLGILALAEQHPLSCTSWAIDWSSQHIRYDIPFWSGGILPSPISNDAYSTDGGKTLVIEFSADTPGSISLQGFHIDTIATVGPSVKPDWEHKIAEEVILALEIDAWERIAGGPWPADSEQGKAFRRTLTADPRFEGTVRTKLVSEDDRTHTSHVLASDHSSWWNANGVTRPIQTYEKLPNWSLGAGAEGPIPIEERMRYVCRRRQFFVTTTGRFGLGPIGIRPRDRVVSLFGSAVPVVLREERGGMLGGLARWAYGRKRPADGEKVFGFVGQAYVDGVMEYEGNVEADVAEGRVVSRSYHLI